MKIAKVRIIESGEIGTVVDDGPSKNGWVGVIVSMVRGGRHVIENFNREEVEYLDMKTSDPMIRAAKKAYRQSDQYVLDPVEAQGDYCE